MGIIGMSILGVAIDLFRLRHRRWREWGAGKYTESERKRLLAAALRKSPRYLALKKAGKTASEITEELQLIHTNPERFERMTGVKWPLS